MQHVDADRAEDRLEPDGLVAEDPVQDHDGASSTSTNMMNVEPSLPWRSEHRLHEVGGVGDHDERDTDDERTRPHVRGVEREEEDGPEQHADEEATPEAPVIRGSRSARYSATRSASSRP